MRPTIQYVKDTIEMNQNEVYGVSTDGIETTPNEVYGVSSHPFQGHVYEDVKFNLIISYSSLWWLFLFHYA